MAETEQQTTKLFVIKRKTKYNPVPAEQKKIILEDADRMIRDGYTLSQIADKHGVSSRTIDGWLADEQDQGKIKAWTSARLARADDLLDQVIEYAARENLTKDEILHGQFRLHCARARAQQSNFIAERRDQRYAQKQEFTQTIVQRDIGLEGRAADLLDLIERGMRDRDSVVVDQDVTD